MADTPAIPRRPDASEVIAARLAAQTFEGLPADTVRATKDSILDTIGCILAGTHNTEVRAIVNLVRGWGGTPAATLIGQGGIKVPPVNAVLANGAAVHQYDFDDVQDDAPCHPAATSLVPALAAAEAHGGPNGGGISGKDLVTAVALGSELTSRVSAAVVGNVHAHVWFRAPIVGLFGATAAAGKAMGLTAEQHLEALGLALPMVGGTFASLQHTGSSVRSIRDGLAFRNGVLAAELARSGLRGDREAFDGPFGFFESFYKGDYTPGAVERDFGTDWLSARVSLKPWPSIRHLHTAITATTELLERHGLAFDEIAEVVLDVGRTNANRCGPVPLGAIPRQRMDCLGNLPFAVAGVIRHRGLPLALYRDTAMADEVIATALPKVRWEYNPALDGRSFEPSRVRIRTTAGVVHEGACEKALGHPGNPMSAERKMRKFLDCAAAAARPMKDSQARAVADMVLGLERLDSIEPLMRALA